MIPISFPSVSDSLSLSGTIARLSASPRVDGIAEFGSQALSQSSPASDYDLLVLVTELPERVFQMVTTISGRLADIVLAPVETADALLAESEQPAARAEGGRSFEALFALKMQTAQIRYDASSRLNLVQQLVTSKAWADRSSQVQPDSDLYAAWFWQSHGLLHLERLAQSHDPVHLSAFDLMLASCLSGTWRSYFDFRRLPWTGEKAAVRYWTEHDPEYLRAPQNCLDLRERGDKLAAYRDFVTRTVEPVGKALRKGETAVILAGANDVAGVRRTLEYWQSLFESRSV